MASKIFLVSFVTLVCIGPTVIVVAEKKGSHMSGVSIRGMLSGLGLRTKDLFTKFPRDLKNLNSWNFNNDCPSGYKVIVKSFSGSTTKDTHSYVLPSIEKGPDCIVLHVGTNDLPDAKKSDVNIAQGIIGLAKKICEDNIEVKVSGLVPRYDKHEPKRVKVNYILRDLCSENKFAFFDLSNIDPCRLFDTPPCWYKARV